MEEWQSAIEAYEKGLTHDPSSELLKNSLADAKAAAAKPPANKSPFARPEFLAKLAMDPRTRGFLGQPDFMSMLHAVQTNPQSMNMFLGDPRFQLMMEIAFGFKMASPGADDFGAAKNDKDKDTAMTDAPSSTAEVKEEKEREKAAPSAADDEAAEERQKKKLKAEAVKEKEAGNEAYKKKDFQSAIDHYNKAIELDDTDISFVTNRAAVYFETKEFDRCIEDCDKAVERGREVRADFKLLAKAMARKGSALVQQGKLEEAITVFNKSLTEHRNPDTLKKLNDAEKALRDKKELEYIDMDKSNEAKELGGQAFKDMKYPEAVAHYQEALKRGPPSVNPEAYKLYSNLAACYTKLVAYPEGIKAADKCIELAPTFAKGYSRKGTLQFFMKETDKAIETYRKGLEHDPDNQELKEGLERCYETITRFATGQVSEEELKERQARSMSDPEVQGLLKDPVVQNVLRDFQEDPKAAQAHLRNPEIMKKINKLVQAGIIQLK